MSLQSVSEHRGRFDKFVKDLFNTHHESLKTQDKAEKERTQGNLDAATVARENEARTCREFRNWCSRKLDEITQILAAPAQNFEENEPAEWRRLHDDIVKQLPKLEADCPGELQSEPPPQPTAKRTSLLS